MNFAAIGIINNRRRPRGPNINRMSCQSAEHSTGHTRLAQQDITALTQEYILWRAQSQGIKTKYHNALNRVELFLQYLAKGGYYRQVGRAEGIAESTAMVYLHSTATFFQHTAAQ